MRNDFLQGFVGPFAMQQAPAVRGYYCVRIDSDQTPVETWYWDGRQWLDSGDGLGLEQPVSQAKGWYGRNPQPAQQIESAPPDS